MGQSIYFKTNTVFQFGTVLISAALQLKSFILQPLFNNTDIVSFNVDMSRNFLYLHVYVLLTPFFQIHFQIVM